MPSSSLIPADPSVLLTTAGMQQFKPYYSGQKDALKDFGSKNTISVQKCFRTSDIDEVGDESHLTFFEMPGNFTLVDHSIFRINKGALGVLHVEGDERPDILKKISGGEASDENG